MRPTLLRYDDATGIADFKLDGETVRIPGLSREGAENVHELRRRGGEVFLTLRYGIGTTPARPARRLDHGGTIIGRPHGV
jgi:hypothetical protein